MSMIQRVANRIQARRRAGSEATTSPAQSPPCTDSVHFNNSGRLDSQEFCVVGEGDASEVSPKLEDTEDAVDLEQVTEDLFGDFDYESEIPKHKILKQEERKPWAEASKDVYEQQLELLQDQLMTTMMEKEALKSEIQRHKVTRQHSERELEDLRKQLREVSGRLKGAARGSSEVASMDGGSRSYAAGSLHVSVSEEGYQEVTLASSEDSGARRSTQKKGLLQVTKDWVYEFLADFTEDPNFPHEQPEEPPPLAYKKLKNNIQRLLHVTKPWKETVQHTQGVLQWKHLAESLVIFLLYMYCVWNGWLITVVLLIAIVKLSINYLHASGLAEQFGFPYPFTPQPTEEPGLANRIQLVRKVAQTCQNLSGQAADTLEKTQNLLLWHQPEATQKLFTVLCGVFVLSLFLSNSYMLTLAGLGVGFKMFIINNIYRKYPKVQQRYDTVHRIWKSLPTDAELYQRQSLTEEELHHSQSVESVSSTRSDGSSSQISAQSNNHSFSLRFNIPPGEQPLPAWETGKRCSIMDRDKPLSLTRSGKLYMTNNYLCFERMSHALRDSSRISIPLLDVVCVSKAKPFAVLPGSGMSIEVTCSDRKKYLFSAILGREQVYRNILDQGMILGLPWGSDVTGEPRKSSPRSSGAVSTSPERGSGSPEQGADLMQDLKSF